MAREAARFERVMEISRTKPGHSAFSSRFPTTDKWLEMTLVEMAREAKSVEQRFKASREKRITSTS